jgi:hypothetical protein
VARGPQPRATSGPARPIIFGAISPAEAKGAALVPPRCTTAAMTLRLAEISQAVAPGAHAVVLLDHAGWHLSAKLAVPNNITLLPPAGKVARAQPGREHLAVHPRKLTLQRSNRIFASYHDILDHCCYAWNRLIYQPLAHNFHWLARLGPSVMIGESWY